MFLSFYFPVIASNILIVKDCLASALFSNWETSTLKLQIKPFNDAITRFASSWDEIPIQE